MNGHSQREPPYHKRNTAKQHGEPIAYKSCPEVEACLQFKLLPANRAHLGHLHSASQVVWIRVDK